MKNLKIDVSDIKNEAYTEKNIDTEADFGQIELRGQDVDVGKVRFKGSITNTKTGLLLKSKATGTIGLDCTRCLEKFAHPLNIEIEEFYALHKNENEELFVEDDIVDVGAAFIQTIALNLDMKSLCKEDCAGLCPKCGLNLNKEQCKCENKSVDIRWSKLQELKKRLNQE